MTRQADIATYPFRWAFWNWTCFCERSLLSPMDIHMIVRDGYDGFKKRQAEYLEEMRPTLFRGSK